MAVILIIDDSPTELHLFQNMLEKNGFDTLVASSTRIRGHPVFR
jgi:twitching motility two-component system response regulator PilH